MSTGSKVLLSLTTLFITDFHAQIEQFPAFLAIFRRKEALIMYLSVFNTDLYGENFYFFTLILKIVDRSYANSK